MSTLVPHGIQGRADLPVPLVVFYWAAAIVLVVSFIGLAFGWRRALLAKWHSEAPARPARRGWPMFIGGAVSFALLLLVIATALFGTTDLNRNLAPVAVFVTWWIGIALAGAFVVDVWRALHPVAWLARILRVPEDRGEFPPAAGVWVAFAGLALFTWLELVYPTAANVRLLGALVVAWSVATFVGMLAFGVTAWLDQGEPFAVYTRVLSSMAPRRDGRWRIPAIGLTALRSAPGLPSFMGLLIGSVSYDGLSRTLWWKQRVGRAAARLAERGIDPLAAQLGYGTLGLVVMVALAIAAFLGAAALARIVGRLPRRTRFGSTADAFAPSLVPIAIAYVVAHYVSYFWFQSQRLVALASDPFGRGWDMFGTAGFEVDYSTLSANAVWTVQLLALVIGHVLGLVFAHDRALEIEAEETGSRAVRSQWPMLGLMILYTITGLYFLSEGLDG